MDGQTVFSMMVAFGGIVISAITLWNRLMARMDAMRASLEQRIDAVRNDARQAAAAVKDLRVHVSESYLHREDASRLESAVIAAINELRADIKEHTKTMTALQVTLRSLNDRLDRLERNGGDR